MSRLFARYTDPARVAAARSRVSGVNRVSGAPAVKYACPHWPECDTKPVATAPASRPRRCRSHGTWMTTPIATTGGR